MDPKISAESPTNAPSPMGQQPGQATPSVGYVTKTATAKCEAAYASTITISGTTTDSIGYIARVSDPALTLNNFVSASAWAINPVAINTDAFCPPDSCSVMTTELIALPSRVALLQPSLSDGGLFVGCSEDEATSSSFEYTFRYTYSQ